jgi:3-oxoadipate enol-lactonase
MALPTTKLIPPSPRIAVDSAGSGTLVAFLHGIGGNRTFWHPQIDAFASHFQAFAWDARGYGLSDDYEGPLQFGDFGKDLLRVLDHFGQERVHLVGLSMGGMIAIDFCSNYPDRVATLTICNSSPGFKNNPPEKMEEFIRLRQKPLLEGKELKDIAPTVARSLVGKSAVATAYGRLEDGMASLHKDSYLKTIETMARVSHLDVSRIRVPTHVIASDEDVMTTPEVMRKMADSIPGAEFSVIAGAGHISNVDQPGTFNDVALPFLLKHWGAV